MSERILLWMWRNRWWLLPLDIAVIVGIQIYLVLL